MLVLLLTLSACGEKKAEESGSESKTASTKEVGSVTTILKDVLKDNNLTEGKVYTNESTKEGEYLNEDLIRGFYGNLLEAPDFTKIQDYCVYKQDQNPLLHIELGIFKVYDSNNNTMVRDFINQRKDSLFEKWANYPSVDKEPWKNIIVDSVGNYTYYIAVKENRDAINKTIRSSLGTD
jgi:hypothetical protein